MATLYLQDPTAARRRVPIYLENSSGNAVIGEVGTPQLLKPGSAAFVATTNALVEIGAGHYYVELTAAELDTPGNLRVRYDSANTVEAITICDVVAQPVVATGTVTAYTDATNLTLPTGLSIRAGNLIHALAGTGNGSAAVISSYDSATGATVLESPGLPAALAATTIFAVYAGAAAPAVADANLVQVNGSTTIETFTPLQLLRLFFSALLGQVTGAGTTTINFRDRANLKNRISATVDASGNRSAVTLDGD